MDANNEEGENSSPLKETARIQFVHQRDIGIARAGSHSSPLARSLRFSSAAPRKHIPSFDSFTALAPSAPTSPPPHVNQCLGEGSRYTILIPSSSSPLLSFPNPAKALSLPPIQCNTLQSNPPLLFSPSHCCAGPVHDVILGNSTSLRFKEVA